MSQELFYVVMAGVAFVIPLGFWRIYMLTPKGDAYKENITAAAAVAVFVWLVFLVGTLINYGQTLHSDKPKEEQTK